MIGPVSIYLSDKWQNAKIVKVNKNTITYSLCHDSDEFVISKDLAYAIIRRRSVAEMCKGNKYDGSNAFIFGPIAAGLYGKKIVERKDRPNVYRVEVKFKPHVNAKRVQHIKINLGKHVGSCLLPCLLLLFS